MLSQPAYGFVVSTGRFAAAPGPGARADAVASLRHAPVLGCPTCPAHFATSARSVSPAGARCPSAGSERASVGPQRKGETQ